MPAFTIDEIPIPDSLDGPGGDDFQTSADIRNAVEIDGYGTDDVRYEPIDLLALYSDSEFAPRRLFAARVDGRMVGRAMHETRPDEGFDTAWASVGVLPEFRGRGIGSALADTVEGIARDANARRLLVYTVSPDGPGERLVPPTGAGSVPRDNTEVRFLLNRGYELGQVERGSRLALPVDRGRFAELWAAADDRSMGYRLQLWHDHTPEQWRDDLVELFTRMSTDTPIGALEEPEDPWSVARLLDEEARGDARPNTMLYAAVEHIESRHLVGYTVLDVPDDVTRPVSQEDTIVSAEHRGHRLGMLLKLANLRALDAEFPGRPSVLTWNAEENRHMLDVNEAIGFVPMGYEGAWKKSF